MAKNNRMKSLGCGVSGLFLVLACGPLGEDGVVIPPISTTGEEEEETESSTTTDGGDSGGSASGGAATSCASQAPPQTYLCAGNAYEDEVAGAAALQLNTERASYACNADEYWYYYYPYYPYEDYGYDEYYYGSTGGAVVGAGGAIVGDGDGDGDGSGGFGMGGVGMGGQVGSGGTWGSGGNWGAGGGIINPPDLLSDWCEDLDADDMVTGASFAVGECQLTDLALPIKITEPQYGAYEVTVYGGESACDRGVVLAKTAGIGTGVPISIPVDPSGYAYVSVEMTSEQTWEGLELRLVDRPAVGDAPGE